MHVALVVLNQRAAGCGRGGTVELQAILSLAVQAHARFERAVDVAHTPCELKARLDAGRREIPVAILARVARRCVHSRAGQARVREGGAALGIGGRARLPAPIAVKLVVVSTGGEGRGLTESHRPCSRAAETFNVEVVDDERVVSSAQQPVLSVSEARIGDVRILVEDTGAQRELLGFGERNDALVVQVALLECLVVAGALALFCHDINTVAASTHLSTNAAIAQRAGRQIHFAGEGGRRLGRDVVDDPANGLGPKAQHARSGQYLDALIALDGRMEIARVVAIGRVGERQPVLE
jgi:hypothetical protein